MTACLDTAGNYNVPRYGASGVVPGWGAHRRATLPTLDPHRLTRARAGEAEIEHSYVIQVNGSVSVALFSPDYLSLFRPFPYHHPSWRAGAPARICDQGVSLGVVCRPA